MNSPETGKNLAIHIRNALVLGLIFFPVLMLAGSTGSQEGLAHALPATTAAEVALAVMALVAHAHTR